ncbi:hypothetical protein ES332_D12G304000v1 [Gossypium tomentosum]|uniref:FAD-binding PCMH-type domain-containing protein n=1 Tax=Gossypium tomentosum TaxID=34277 RepID=A0A5D2IGI9_GOSTO|nr:hypothetical protein ES332_D12G304000v1 [Gossypium tomentosum]
MTPYVSKSPRESYINYRDLDIGTNKINNSKRSYAKARVWGVKYFKNNFNRISASAQPAQEFLHCLSLRFHNSSSFAKLVYTQHNSSYSSVLKSSAQNLRFTTPSTPTPLAIVTPLHASHIQAAVHCCRKHGLQVKTRSGGHDFEGLSYTTAYKVPCIGRTVGLGGHLSGGGYGVLFRKYGLGADNVIDACLIDVKGRILDKKSMGEDLFWAIRGGGGGSFGIVLAWKLKLVPVLANVTVFTVSKTLEQNATKLVHQCQYIAHKLPKEIHMSIIISRVNSSENEKMTVQASFTGIFLGSTDELVPLMEEKFPQLGIVKEDCFEMSWAESNLWATLSLETLLERSQKSVLSKTFFKAKSDYVKQLIPESAFQGLWPKFYEDEAKFANFETESPYPHSAGNLYSILYVFMSWMRRVYNYMTPFVSKSPREAYSNYRDLDIEANKINNDKESYAEARVWGLKYFKNNFDRLVHIKTKVDSQNFFRHE